MRVRRVSNNQPDENTRERTHVIGTFYTRPLFSPCLVIEFSPLTGAHLIKSPAGYHDLFGSCNEKSFGEPGGGRETARYSGGDIAGDVNFLAVGESRGAFAASPDTMYLLPRYVIHVSFCAVPFDTAAPLPLPLSEFARGDQHRYVPLREKERASERTNERFLYAHGMSARHEECPSPFLPPLRQVIDSINVSMPVTRIRDRRPDESPRALLFKLR